MSLPDRNLVLGEDLWHEKINANNEEIEQRLVSAKNNNFKFNIFINANFSSNSLVNQRGQTSYTEANGYTIDMWKLVNGVNTNVQLDVETDNIKIISTGVGSGAYTDFTQLLENRQFYKDKTITVTIDYLISTNAKVSFRADGLPLQERTGDGLRYKESFTFTYTDILNNMFTVRLNRDTTNNVGDYIKIFSIKAELGEVATPFFDDDPATKINKCQRYLQKISKGFYRATQVTSAIFFTIPIKTMRISPILIYTGNLTDVILTGDIGSLINITNEITSIITQPNLTDTNNLTLRFTMATSPREYKEAVLNTQLSPNMFFSAEM